MTVHKGSTGTVKVGTNAIAEIVSFQFEESADTIESTALSNSARSYVSDLLGWSGSVECFYDPSDTNGQEAMSISSTVTLYLYNIGAESSDKYAYGSAIITGISRSNAGGALVTSSFSFQGTGGLTWDTV